MTKLCPRGKAAAKRKFKVYPSAYANAYASKICAGKIKDPSGTKRKDWGPKKANEGVYVEAPKQPRRPKGKGPYRLSTDYIKKKKVYDTLVGDDRRKRVNDSRMRPGAKVGMAVTAGSQSATGRLEKSGIKKMMSGGFGIFSKKKKEKEEKSVQEENANKKKKRLEELRKEIGAKKGKMMIMIAIGKPKKANKGLHAETKKKKKAVPGDPKERRDYLRDIQNPKSEYDKKGKLKYTFANKGKIMQVANKLEKASKAHAGQAKTLKSLKLSRGGGAAIRGTNFKGVF
jgi:hypothetical protein